MSARRLSGEAGAETGGLVAAGSPEGSQSAKGAWAVVCDFDGTATVEDIADALSIRYVGFERWKRANDLYQAGAMPFEDLLRAIFEPVDAGPEEVRAFALEHAHYRSGFERLVTVCRRLSYPFVLASGGLDVYIRPALEKLPGALAEGLELRANHAEFTGTGLAITFPFKDAPGACGNCGSCKGAMVRELQARGHRVLAVGDGNADRCAARVADLVYARGRLLEWCLASGVPCESFETLDPVADRLEKG